MPGRQPFESRLVCIPNGSGYISRHWQKSINSALGVGGARGTVSFRSTPLLAKPVELFLRCPPLHQQYIARHAELAAIRVILCAPALRLCEKFSDARCSSQAA